MFRVQIFPCVFSTLHQCQTKSTILMGALLVRSQERGTCLEPEEGIRVSKYSFLKQKYLFIYFWLHQVFFAAHRLSGVQFQWAQCVGLVALRHLGSYGFPGGASGKESACQSACQCWFRSLGQEYPWVRKIPWGRAQQPSPVFLPRESHGQKSLEGYRP